MEYQGDVLGYGQIRPQVGKVEAILACPTPTTKRLVKSFLRLVGWYQRFILNFPDHAAPLTELTKMVGHNKLRWTPDYERAFQDLKNSMCSKPLLQSPDFDKPFTVQTDASGVGFRAALLQGEYGSAETLEVY